MPEGLPVRRTVKLFAGGWEIEGPSSSEEVYLFTAPHDMTITEINAVLVGSGSQSVSWNILFDSDRTPGVGTLVLSSSQVTTSITTGDTVTSFANADISAGDHVRVVTTALVATVVSFCGTVVFS